MRNGGAVTYKHRSLSWSFVAIAGSVPSLFDSCSALSLDALKWLTPALSMQGQGHGQGRQREGVRMSADALAHSCDLFRRIVRRLQEHSQTKIPFSDMERMVSAEITADDSRSRECTCIVLHCIVLYCTVLYCIVLSTASALLL